MKFTSRMKFALIQRLVINAIFFLILALVYLFYLNWEIENIEIQKERLSERFEYYNKIETDGVDFARMNSLLVETWKTRDRFLKNTIAQLDAQFYTQHFKNTTNENYVSFIREKMREVDEIRSSEIYVSRYETLDSILPVYSPFVRISESDMSTSDFINYIENLLNTFGIVHRGEIGVRNLEIIESWSNNWNTGSNENLSMSENVFSIPVDLNIEWRKWNIVNFIHYLSYVGTVTPDFENNSLIVYDDDFFEWFANSAVISHGLNWQMASIEEITFPLYLDSSASQSDVDFTTRIRSGWQYVEAYNIQMSINFYVAGYPQFRINESIENLIAELSEDLEAMDNTLKQAEEAFETWSTQSRADHRAAARAVSRLKENYRVHSNIDLTMLGQEEVIEMYSTLQQTKILKDITKERYNLFFR